MKTSLLNLAIGTALIAISVAPIQAAEIKLPGISISDEGVRIGDVSISEGGVVITEGTVGDDENRGAGPRIVNADHSRSNFEGNNLVGARISNSDFSRSNLNSADLRNARIRISNVSRAQLISVNLHRANISGSNFSRSKLGNTNIGGGRISGSDFSRTNFDGANLRGVIFENSDLSRASFVGACLYGAKFIDSDFSRANFKGAILTNTDNIRSLFGRAIMDNVDRSSSCGNHGDGTGWSQDSSSIKVDINRAEIATASSILSALAAGKNSSISLTVHFALDSDRIDGDAQEQIYEISAALAANDLQNTAILIEGHTDSSGQNDYNQDLSYRRALRVKNILVDQYDVNSELLSIRGLGESTPVASNASSQGRALNRRVTLVNQGKQ